MDKENSVNHIAIIMDGNGRWATDKGLPRVSGHKKGAEVVLEIVEAAAKSGVKCLTLFVFSSENWGRPKEEVDHLMMLMREYVSKQFKNLIKQNIKVKVIGDVNMLPLDLQTKIKEVEELSKNKNGLTVNLAVSYGGQSEIINACKNIAEAVKNKEINIEDINKEIIENNLYTAGVPNPDVVIRTGGDCRISNFLLWQIAYSELFFLDKYWPDFNKKDLENIINKYKNRNRRFGKV